MEFTWFEIDKTNLINFSSGLYYNNFSIVRENDIIPFNFSFSEGSYKLWFSNSFLTKCVTNKSTDYIFNNQRIKFAFKKLDFLEEEEVRVLQENEIFDIYKLGIIS